MAVARGRAGSHRRRCTGEASDQVLRRLVKLTKRVRCARSVVTGVESLVELGKGSAYRIAVIIGVLIGCRESPRIYAELSAAPGVRTGASVSFRGVPVGVVEKIAFTESGVRLTLVLTRTDVP